MEFTQEIVKELFDYKDGLLYWKNPPKFSWVKVGSPAGGISKRPKGDRYGVKIFGKSYISARIIFLFHKGYLPKIVDHKDRDMLNDKIENLRAADYSDNSKNRSAMKGCSSKYKGVNLDGGKYWRAAISIDGKRNHLGSFKTQELAAIAYNAAAIEHYGEFACLNIIEEQ